MRRIEKLMSVSRREFEDSWRTFAAEPPPGPGAPARLAAGAGAVTVGFEPRPPARLGGLLELPRAAVTFTFDGVAETDAAALLLRFDRAFQRGGG